MAHARDVAAVVRDLCSSSPGDVKVHKLLYYAQAWHAVWTGEPLFDEEIQAWKMGPVVADLAPPHSPLSAAGAETLMVDRDPVVPPRLPHESEQAADGGGVVGVGSISEARKASE